MTFSARLAVQLAASMDGTLEIERLGSSIDRTWQMILEDGTGAGQANNMWSDNRTLASNTSENLDLAGSLENAFGAALTFTKVKAYILIADRDNTTVLTVGNVANGIVAPLGAATHSLQLRPGGMIVIAAPDNTAFGVTADTGDLLKISNAAGAAAKYDVVVIGVA